MKRFGQRIIAASFIVAVSLALASRVTSQEKDAPSVNPAPAKNQLAEKESVTKEKEANESAARPKNRIAPVPEAGDAPSKPIPLKRLSPAAPSESGSEEGESNEGEGNAGPVRRLRPRVVDENGKLIPNGTAAAPLRTTVLRPAMTAEQRKDWATRLREVYSQPADRWPAPNVDQDVKWQELGLIPEPKHPESNPGTKEKIELGQILFFDPRLSGNSQIACASCHEPELHWADGRTTAIGNNRRVLKRNTPTIMNVGLHEKLFWDGRAGSLEEQAKQVLSNVDEMDSSEKIIQEHIGNIPEYQKRFEESFGDKQITLDRVVAAISAFERTVVGGMSKFDNFLKGRHDALSDEAVVGLHIYRTEARCMNCHNGANFTDNQFHEVGLSYYKRKYEDLGRYKITNEKVDVGRFKTPTLRNIGNTAPYMHNGLFPLEGVLNMYNAGMPTIRRRPEFADDEMFPTKSAHLHRLNLNGQDLASLKEFLLSLNEPKRRIRPPELPGMNEKDVKDLESASRD